MVIEKKDKESEYILGFVSLLLFACRSRSSQSGGHWKQNGVLYRSLRLDSACSGTIHLQLALKRKEAKKQKL